MEFTIHDSTETAQIKLKATKHRVIFVFRYLSLILLFLGVISLIFWYVSLYTNHSSVTGSTRPIANNSTIVEQHHYTTYHVGLGIGLGTLIVTAYLELYIFKLKKTLGKFSFSAATYNFSESVIKVTSSEFETIIDWKAVKGIRKLKGKVLVETNNYSCPSLLFLESQISPDQISWIWHRIRKTNN